MQGRIDVGLGTTLKIILHDIVQIHIIQRLSAIKTCENIGGFELNVAVGCSRKNWGSEFWSYKRKTQISQINQVGYDFFF